MYLSKKKLNTSRSKRSPISMKCRVSSTRAWDWENPEGGPKKKGKCQTFSPIFDVPPFEPWPRHCPGGTAGHAVIMVRLTLLFGGSTSALRQENGHSIADGKHNQPNTTQDVPQANTGGSPEKRARRGMRLTTQRRGPPRKSSSPSQKLSSRRPEWPRKFRRRSPPSCGSRSPRAGSPRCSSRTATRRRPPPPRPRCTR